MRRLLVPVLVAVLGGGASAQAIAKPAAKHRKARKATAKRQRAHAVKLDGALAWVPPAALSGAAPLAGTTGAATAPAPAVAAAPPPTTATDPTSGYVAPPAPDTAPPSVQAVGVTVDDRGGYSARLSRASVNPGAVVVQLRNQGEDDHNLRVVPTDHAGAAIDFPLTGSGQNSTKTLTLSAGSYRLFCTLTAPVNHETAGMNATLNVS